MIKVIEIGKVYGYRGSKVQVLNIYTKEGVKLVTMCYLDNMDTTTLLYKVCLSRFIEL